MPVTFDVAITIPRINPFLELLILGDMIRVSHDWAVEVRREAMKYPPPRPKQRYRRTYRLKHNWTISGPVVDSQGNVVTEVTNATPYGPKVHGDSFGHGQRVVHQGRWPKLLQIGVNVLPLQARVEHALNRRLQHAFVHETIRRS